MFIKARIGNKKKNFLDKLTCKIDITFSKL